jgi:hypothetical protein
MAVIEFARIGQGGRRAGEACDLHVYATQDKKGRMSLGLRVSGKVMARMRWIIGDYVKASYDGDNKRWTLTRVPADGGGNKLSAQGKTDGHGTVRFAIDPKVEARIFPNSESHSAKLVDASESSAIFLVE